MNIYLFFEELGLDQIFSCGVELDGCVPLSTSSDHLIWAYGLVVCACFCLVGGLFFDASPGSLVLLGGHLLLV